MPFILPYKNSYKFIFLTNEVLYEGISIVDCLLESNWIVQKCTVNNSDIHFYTKNQYFRDLILTEDGAIVLNKFPKELIRL